MKKKKERMTKLIQRFTSAGYTLPVSFCRMIFSTPWLLFVASMKFVYRSEGRCEMRGKGEEALTRRINFFLFFCFWTLNEKGCEKVVLGGTYLFLFWCDISKYGKNLRFFGSKSLWIFKIIKKLGNSWKVDVVSFYEIITHNLRTYLLTYS